MVMYKILDNIESNEKIKATLAVPIQYICGISFFYEYLFCDLYFQLWPTKKTYLYQYREGPSGPARFILLLCPLRRRLPPIPKEKKSW